MNWNNYIDQHYNVCTIDSVLCQLQMDLHESRLNNQITVCQRYNHMITDAMKHCDMLAVEANQGMFTVMIINYCLLFLQIKQLEKFFALLFCFLFDCFWPNECTVLAYSYTRKLSHFLERVAYVDCLWLTLYCTSLYGIFWLLFCHCRTTTAHITC